MRDPSELSELDLSGFSGVASIGELGDAPTVRAAGLADRRWSIDTTPATVFGIASGTKGFTATTVMAIVDAGELDLSTTARSLLGSDLPLVDDRVTVLDLLTHRSGIGDYVDEEAIDSVDDHILSVPVHQLDHTTAYLPVLDGHPQREAPGQRFVYNNSGFVLLALLAERATGIPFERAMHRMVIEPAGLKATEFHRMDTLPTGVATGYLSDDPSQLRTNELHLPVRGSGDGGLFSCADDIHRFWAALFDGRLVTPPTFRSMIERRTAAHEAGYGLGFWLGDDGTVRLEGHDAGVSFASGVDPASGRVWSVLSNTAGGVWPIAQQLGPTA
jgi:CubicO group peptidase (beta-lactamase class C family)